MPEIELSETCAALCWEGEDLTWGRGGATVSVYVTQTGRPLQPTTWQLLQTGLLRIE